MSAAAAVAPFAPKIRQMASSYARGVDVDDLEQDLHVKALELQVDHPDKPQLYVLKSLWNHAKRWRTTNAKRHENITFWEDFELTPDDADAIEDLERRSCVQRLERALCESHIQTLKLWTDSDMKEIHILKTLEVSKRTWQKRVHKARAAARDALEVQHHGRRATAKNH